MSCQKGSASIGLLLGVLITAVLSYIVWQYVTAPMPGVRDGKGPKNMEQMKSTVDDARDVVKKMNERSEQNADAPH